ncbi:uncharacterized protein LOC113324360 [Papaver somniferum]|uniref:uncharacterized protein LOC113324360 n=1 Tax=Papaver somniferum TaxID=3469 RepID=UPI000E6F51A3|nr:uncharacterized protein LOC113324360 [Papaver somniferum]
MKYSNWKPPPNDIVKFNVDGSYIQYSNSFGTGVVLRNHTCTCHGIKGSYGDGALNPEAVECMAVIEALSWAKDLKFSRIQIEADAKLVIDTINGNILLIQWENRNIIKEIKYLISSFSLCEFVHVSRDNNQVADAVAKHVSQSALSILTDGNFNAGFYDLLAKDHNPC